MEAAAPTLTPAGPPARPAPPGRWRRFRTRSKTVLAGVGLITVSGAALQAWAARRRLSAGLPEEGFILELDLEQNKIVEFAKPRSLAALLDPGHDSLQLSAVAEALREAGSDTRVRGLLALVGGGGSGAGLGFAQTQELRDALAEFRRRAGARAPTLAYSDAFGEAGAGGTGAYYLACACQLVALQPSGTLSVTGLAATTPYARGFLDRWRVKPFFFAREEYKSAASFLLNRSSSKAEREAMRSTLDSLSGQVVAGIGAARGLTPKQVQAAIDTAPHQPSDALRLGLVDASLYRDQALKLISRLAEAQAPGGPAPDISITPAASKAANGEPAVVVVISGQPKACPAAGTPTSPAQLQAMLAEPDVGAGKPLKHVPIARYMVAVKERQRQREAAERWASGAGLVQRAKELVGWTPSEEAVAGTDGSEGVSARDSSVSKLPSEGSEASSPSTAASKQAQQGTAERGHVALLTLCGPISLGPGGPLGLTGDPSAKIASLPVIKGLREAREDPAVKAVVLRVDSPGGSAAASDAIHREVSLLRTAGKPVVVSMGNAAASGGYYIACAANKIVAQPGTITGSIGVIAGKLVFDDALREYGVAVETVQTGKNAAAMSAFSGFDKEQKRKVEGMIDDVYSLFKRRVAEGRGLSDKAVAKLARGRVWTGEQAVGLGLVDQLGGLEAAIRLAKKEAGLPEEEGVVPVKQVFPERKSPLAQALKAMSSNDSGTSSPPGKKGGGGSEGNAAAAAWAMLGQRLPLTGAEWALLAQQQPAVGGSVPPQCLAMDAERLAATL